MVKSCLRLNNSLINIFNLALNQIEITRSNLFIGTEKRPTTLVEELQTQLSHGSSRNQDHHPLKLPALPLRRRLRPKNSLLLTSVLNPTHFTLMPTSPTPTLRIRSNLSILMMQTVLLNMEPQPQD